MKILIIFILLLELQMSNICAFAQNSTSIEELENKIQQLDGRINLIQSGNQIDKGELEKNNSVLSDLILKFGILQSKIQESSNSINKITDELNLNISKTDTNLSSLRLNLDSLKKQNEESVNAINKITDELNFNISKTDTNLSSLRVNFDSLKKQNDENIKAINKTNEELGLKISKTESNSNQKISEVYHSLTKHSYYGIFGVILAILFSGLLYYVLRKRQKTDKSDFIEQLNKTKASIDGTLIKELCKQTELIDKNLHLIEQQKIIQDTTPNAEPDHSLALKTASEINLIEKNVSFMDIKTKGLKQIVASVGRLKDNLAANGYEMPELLGKKFHEGMNIIVSTSITDETISDGAIMISKIFIPQVNYNDKMIQAAQIETSQGL